MIISWRILYFPLIYNLELRIKGSENLYFIDFWEILFLLDRLTHFAKFSVGSMKNASRLIWLGKYSLLPLKSQSDMLSMVKE